MVNMATHVSITKKQAEQFNYMLSQLKKIAKAYQTPAQLRKSSRDEYGLGYEETLEMAYENLQSEAAMGSRNVKQLKY